MHVSLLNSSRSELIILSKFASREERAWTAKRGRTSENRDKRGIFSASLRRSKSQDFVVSHTISQSLWKWCFPRRVSAPYYGPKWPKYKYLLLAELSVRTVNYGPTFFRCLLYGFLLFVGPETSAGRTI